MTSESMAAPVPPPLSGAGPEGAAPAAELHSPASLVTAGRVLSVVVPMVLWFIPLDLEPHAQHALAIAMGAIIAWTTHAYDLALVGVAACYLFWALHIVTFDVAFSGFSNTTPWFLFGAMLFGLMATKSGLARRLAYLVMRRMGHSYARLLLGLIITDFLLTLLVPSGVARVILMAAIALGLIEAFGVGPGSNIGRGMFIILTYTATTFDKMIIAGAASITARGIIEKVGQVNVLWSHWFLAYLPCDLITIFFAWRLVLWLYPPEKPDLPGGASHLDRELEKMGKWTTLEKKSALLMLLAVCLWMTDFLHHISPPLIGLGIGLVATLPRIGVLDIGDVKKLNFLAMFFVATALSVSEVLRHTKALDILSNLMITWIEPSLNNPWLASLSLYWTAFFYHIFIGDEIAMLSTSLPVLLTYAKTHSLDPLTLGMMWTFSVGGKIFIYQSAVLVVGYSYGYFDGRDMFRIGMAITLVQSLILLLLVPLYWPLIGL